MKTLIFFLLSFITLAGICQEPSKGMEPMDYLRITFLDSKGDKIFEEIDVYSEAQFPGGELEMERYMSNYIKENLKVKEDSYRGIYFNVQFTVNREGEIVDAKTYIKNDDFYDNQLIEAIKQMPNWTPATIADSTVSQVIKRTYAIPIKHKIVLKPKPEIENLE
jgi:hypothetical protein